MNDTIETLFSSLISSGVGERLYKPLISYGEEQEAEREKAYKDLGLNIEQQNRLDNVLMDCACLTEQHGFEQGLKLGIKLAVAVFSNTGK